MVFQILINLSLRRQPKEKGWKAKEKNYLIRYFKENVIFNEALCVLFK